MGRALGIAALRGLGRLGEAPDGGPNLSSNISGGSPVVVDFHATWCGPCKRMDPVIASLASQYPGQVYQVDIDQYESIANQYDVHAVPTFIVFQNGSEQFRHSGIRDQSEIAGWLGGSGDSTASAPVSAPASAPAPSPSRGSSAPAAWGAPPDGSGQWEPAYLDGNSVWHNTSTGDFIPIGQSAPASVTAAVQSAPAAAAAASSGAGITASPAAAPVQTVTVSVSANPTDWTYILQHGNRKWEAVLLDGNQMFRNKKTGQFVSSIVGMNGLALAGVHGLLGTATLPVKSYTSEGTSLSVKTAGLILGGVALTGIVGYVLYRVLRK